MIAIQAFNTKTATAKKLCKGVFKMLESEVFTTVAGYKKALANLVIKAAKQNKKNKFAWYISM